eukprot:492274-Pyramimonas_sp.AAC.1
MINDWDIGIFLHFLDVARSRSDARPDFGSRISGPAERSEDARYSTGRGTGGSPPYWEAIPRRGVPGGRPRNVKE